MIIISIIVPFNLVYYPKTPTWNVVTQSLASQFPLSEKLCRVRTFTDKLIEHVYPYGVWVAPWRRAIGDLLPLLSKGTIHKGCPHRGGRRVAPKADIVREVVWIKYYKSSQNADKGGGVRKPKILRTSLVAGWSLARLENMRNKRVMTLETLGVS